jgi:rhodanese-related sulfurtransferase
MQTATSVKALLVIAVGLSTSPAFGQDTARAGAGKPAEAKTHILSRAEFDKLAAHPERLVVIDVRRPDEVTAIGGFPVYLSIQPADLEKSLDWIPKERQVVVVSNHSGRAGKAGDLLTARGFNVAGRIGVQNYEEEGGKLTRIAPKAPPKTAQAK